MTASQQLGIDFSVQHIKDLLQAFVDARKESQTTAKSLVKDASDVTKSMRSLKSAASAKSLLSTATVSANPSQGVNASLSGTTLKIEITLKAAQYVSASGAGGASSVARAGRLRQIPAPLRPTIMGPNQRRAQILNGIATANMLNDPAALADAQRALEANNRLLYPRGKTKALAAFPTGPRQQMERLHGLMPSAISSGNLAAFDDMHDSYMRLHKRLQLRQPKNALWELAMTSRYGAGGAMPLVGKTLDAAGGRNSVIGKSLLGIGILANAAIALGKTFYDLSNQGKDYLLGINKMVAATGGSALENAKLRGIGISAGLGNDEMAGLAKNLQQSISSPGYGMAFGAMLGVHNLPGPLGSQNLAAQELTVANKLHAMYLADKSPNQGNTLRIARALGQDALIPALKSNDWGSSIQASVSAMPTKDQMIQALKLQAAEGNVADSFGKLVASITGKQGVIDALNSFAKILRDLSGATPLAPLRHLATLQAKAGMPPSGPMMGAIGVYRLLHAFDKQKNGQPFWAGPAMGVPPRGHPSFAAASPRAEVMAHRYLMAHAGADADHITRLHKANDALVPALLSLTDAVKKGLPYPGTYGSGNQSRQGAFPKGLDNGWVLNKYMNARALQLGSF